MNNLLVYKDLFLDEDVKKCISFIKHKDNEEKFISLMISLSEKYDPSFLPSLRVNSAPVPLLLQLLLILFLIYFIMIFIFLMIYIRIYFFILIILKQLLIVRYLSC